MKKNPAKILIKSRLRQTVGDEVRSIVTILIIAQCTQHFASKIVLIVSKNCSSDQKFTTEDKTFEIIRTQFWAIHTIFATEYFLTCYWRCQLDQIIAM